VDVKDDDKAAVTDEPKAAPDANGADAMKDMEELAAVFAEEAPAKDAKTSAPAPAVITTAKEEEPVQTIARRPNEKESELTTLSGLLLIGLAVSMFYVGTVVFAKDSLIFFAGIFVYLIIAPPGTYAQGKSKMASFTKELAIAFALTFVLFMILKNVLPPDADQAELFTIVLAILGIKLVHYPYYNAKDDQD
jgi:hypothetical protein